MSTVMWQTFFLWLWTPWWPAAISDSKVKQIPLPWGGGGRGLWHNLGQNTIPSLKTKEQNKRILKCLWINYDTVIFNIYILQQVPGLFKVFLLTIFWNKVTKLGRLTFYHVNAQGRVTLLKRLSFRLLDYFRIRAIYKHGFLWWCLLVEVP